MQRQSRTRLAVLASVIGAVSVGIGFPQVAEASTQSGALTRPTHECQTNHKTYCGGYVWAPLPKRYVPKADAKAWAWGTLKSAKGEKLKAIKWDFWRSPYEWNHAGRPLENTALFKLNGRQGPRWDLPSHFKKGTYTLNFKVKASGFWACSVYYHDVCKWTNGFTYTRTIKIHLAPKPPKHWMTYDN